MRSQKQARGIAHKLMKKPESKFERIKLDEVNHPIPPGMTRAYRNSRYTVMIYDNVDLSGGIRASQVLIQNHMDTPIVNHWRELQRIKNTVFGEDAWAVEYFPDERELIDDHNIYWLFVINPDEFPVPFAHPNSLARIMRQKESVTYHAHEEEATTNLSVP